MAKSGSYQPGVMPTGQQDTRPAFQKIEGDVSSLFAGHVPVRKVVLSATLTENDRTVFVAGPNTVTITLPAPSLKASTVGGQTGKQFELVNTQAQAVTVRCIGGAQVNGAASYTLAAGASVVFRTDGNNWYV